MNRKYLYPVLIIIVTVALYYGEEYVDKLYSPYSKPVTEKQSTEFDEDILPTSTTSVIIEHNYYTLSYSEKDEQAEWVAYELKKSHLTKNNFKRPYFVEDPKVKTISADWRNYKNSGYDRGHLCPAADRGFLKEAYDETFLTSNISPQNREFNGGIWNRLEQKVRYWANGYDGVYVITGGNLKNKLNEIGYENITVPDEFFKIVVDKSNGKYKAIAFLIPNKSSRESFYKYAVSIDEIEAKTGIDFFPQLPDSIEDELESANDPRAWGKK